MRIRPVLGALFLVTALPAAARAQVAAAAPAAPVTASNAGTGKWAGSVNHPAMGVIDVVLDVSATEPGRGTLDLPAMAMGFKADGVKLEGTKLRFGFTVEGQGDVRCELTRRDDNTFGGTCIESGGGDTSTITLKPPAAK